MPKTIKNGAGTILNGKGVLACVLMDGSTITDLAGNTLSVGAGLATGSTQWLTSGPSIPWWRAVDGTSGFDPRLVEWSTFPAAQAPSQITVYVLSLGRPDGGSGVNGHRAMVSLVNAGNSAGINFIAGDGDSTRMQCHTGSTISVQRSDSIPSSPVLYKFRWVPFGSTPLGQVQGGGSSAPTALNEQTPTDGGFGTGDNLRLRSIGGVPGNGRCSHNIALVLVLGGGSTLSGAEETTLLADPIGAVSQEAAPTATLAGALDTITGAIVAGAADISATLAGTLDSITGNLAAGGNTGRLTSTLPLRDAARLVLANRNDLVVHVLGKPGLGSVILLNPQSTNSGGFWTAPGPFIPGNRYNVMYELAGEPIGCEIITAGAV